MKTEPLDLKTFPWPKLNAVDCVFGTMGADPKLLDEAYRRGFLHGNTPWEGLASSLFFKGGKLNLKKDLPEEFEESAIRYLKSLMGSFEPKHEHKISICALILSELCENAETTQPKET